MKKYDFLNNKTKSITPYVPGEQPQTDDWIKLNTNENPHPPSPKVNQVLSSLADDASVLCKYPHPFGEPLRGLIASQHNIKAEQVLVCNGSDEALHLLCEAVLDQNKTAAYSNVTYSLYSTLVQLARGNEVLVDMRHSDDNPFAIDLNKLENSKSEVVFLPNPNAQIGEYLDREKVKEIISKSNKLWVVDEAYNDFAGDNCTMSVYLNELPNLVVVRTFSKSHGLAGLRLGYAMSSNVELMKGLYAIKDSYNIDAVAIRLGVAAYQDQAYYNSLVKINLEQKKYLVAELKKLNFKIIPSAANFLLVKHKTIEVNRIFAALKSKKILVRHFNDSLIEKYLRITIGNEKQNLALVESLKSIV